MQCNLIKTCKQNEQKPREQKGSLHRWRPVGLVHRLSVLHSSNAPRALERVDLSWAEAGLKPLFFLYNFKIYCDRLEGLQDPARLLAFQDLPRHSTMTIIRNLYQFISFSLARDFDSFVRLRPTCIQGSSRSFPQHFA